MRQHLFERNWAGLFPGRHLSPQLFSRIILSPLLPTIERELAISHSQAGFFFFLTSGGYLVGLLSSGLFASRSTHRLAIIVSSAGVGIAMLTVAFAGSLWLMRCGFFGVGFAAGFTCRRPSRRSRRWSTNGIGAKRSRCTSWRRTWRFSSAHLSPSYFFAGRAGAPRWAFSARCRSLPA